VLLFLSGQTPTYDLLVYLMLEGNTIFTPTKLAPRLLPEDEISLSAVLEDGAPITIRTRGYRRSRSLPSMMIESLKEENNSSSPKGGESSTNIKPSVRTRLEPSKSLSKSNRIKTTESKPAHKSGRSKRAYGRLPVINRAATVDTDLQDSSGRCSSASGAEESNTFRYPPQVGILPVKYSRHRHKISDPPIPDINNKACLSVPSSTSGISAISTASFSHEPGQVNERRYIGFNGASGVRRIIRRLLSSERRHLGHQQRDGQSNNHKNPISDLRSFSAKTPVNTMKGSGHATQKYLSRRSEEPPTKGTA
jgi:hypothetical protein